jgi:molybdopterin-containing oxidoreductase family iron-sulfur binding subunit
MPASSDTNDKRLSRRGALKILGSAVAGAAAAGCAGGAGYSEWLQSTVQEHYQRMTPEEVTDTLARLERKYARQTGVDVHVKATPALPGVLYGYALNISKCKGYRECVRACAEEDNVGTNQEMAYIQVLEMEHGTLDLSRAVRDFEKSDKPVPQEGKYYLPVSCMQCDEPPCTKACPVKATWREQDGIVVIDYDWCIGCRYCQAACPYDARRFNFSIANLDPKTLQTDTHYLGNRPRPRGVVEKCTFCVSRVREGKQPACQEACPTGARIFGNLLDPRSDIRFVLENKHVFRLKEDLKTEPKFWYFTD